MAIIVPTQKFKIIVKLGLLLEYIYIYIYILNGISTTLLFIMEINHH